MFMKFPMVLKCWYILKNIWEFAFWKMKPNSSANIALCGRSTCTILIKIGSTLKGKGLILRAWLPCMKFY